MTQNIAKAVEQVQYVYNQAMLCKADGNTDGLYMWISEGIGLMDMFHTLTGDYIRIEDGVAVHLHG